MLVVTDQFTRFAQAFITTSQTAQTTAKTLWDKYFVYYGFPEMIISDQGRNFESRLISKLCKLGRVKKLRTSPYHPQSNGQCERFNATLLSMLLGQTKLDPWSMLITVLRVLSQALVHTTSCLGESLNYP